MDARTALDEQSRGCIADAILKKMAEFGVFSADPAEIVEAQAFAARLIGPNIAQAETLRRVHQITGVGLFVAREEGEIAGVVAFVPLSAEGLRATREDAFRAVDPAAAHISVWGEDPAGLYGWGVAAASS